MLAIFGHFLTPPPPECRRPLWTGPKLSSVSRSKGVKFRQKSSFGRDRVRRSRKRQRERKQEKRNGTQTEWTNGHPTGQKFPLLLLGYLVANKSDS